MTAFAYEQWKSYEDICTWFATEFRYDHKRFKEGFADSEGNVSRQIAKTPQQTFEQKSGVCQDVVKFILHCLQKIYPESNARILVIIIRQFRYMHFIPIFNLNGQLHLIEYGSWAYSMHGLRGPFDTVEDIISWYTKYHPRQHSIHSYFIGWPSAEHFKREEEK